MAENLDVALAVERISEARAALRTKGVNEILSGGLGYSSTTAGGTNSSQSESNVTSLNGDLVIDLFGGARRSREVAQAELLGTIDDLDSANLAFLSELVGAYIDARYYQYATKLTRQSVETRERTLAITEQQYDVGEGTELDIEQVKALLFAAQADIPDLEASYLAQVYAVATLLDKSASEVIEQLDENRQEIELLGLNLEVEYDTGIPADLIRNRPDIRSAEQALIAATANVGVAIADMLPSISLSGTISTSEVTSWSFGPSLSLPVFNQGALAARRDVAISQARQAEINWRQTVLGAVEDVQAANSAWIRDREKVDLLRESMDAYQRSLDLSFQTYEAGATTRLELLDTDRSLASARIQFANALRDLSIDWATLQIALGAGARAAY